METPDSNGYVNITWPSKNIPHGGIFHTKVHDFSPAQQSFLKVLLDESKFTIEQRRKTAFTLRQNDGRKEKPAPKARENVRILRPRTSCRRSLSAIRASGVLEPDTYKPLKRGEDREKLKERLADFMTYGDLGQRPPKPARPIKIPPKLPTNKEKWNDLVTQIRERADWLAEMEMLGEADLHREVIQDQIAERIRALDALGIDSECSSARSRRSGFSVLDTGRRSVRSKDSDNTERTTSSKEKKVLKKGQTKKNKEVEENVDAYSRLSPLEYTPRRRV
ncbi:UPF0193 protein EVG1-like [Papilio xuthus]|uniref:UPF0193 protein EVG1-like n=1 Tax=Papilio xuthus TaxID=66420 RepID=A0A194QAW0_PAPXU|nr:UPF0193 protein EVG1-like [Papilio xuthus]